MRLLSIVFYCASIILCSSLSAHQINSSIHATAPLDAESGPSQGFEHFIEIASLNEIAGELAALGEGTLVVFDIDEVLIASKDRFFHPLAEPYMMSLVKQEMEQAQTAAERKDIEEKLSLSLIQSERVLLDDTSPKLLHTLKSNGVKAMALTGFPTGKFGKIEALERWKIEQLESFGLDFSPFFPSMPQHLFQEMAKPKISPPIFLEGVLYARGYSKGDVLLAFLDLIQWTPSQVIFIDDLYHNLAAMECSLKERGIAFKGYRYSGADISFNEEDKQRIDWQFRMLMENRSWISDEKANPSKLICAP